MSGVHLSHCKNPKEPVPWKEVILRQDELIPPPYLPEGKKLREPSRMTWHEETELLQFWWWSKVKKEVRPPVIWNCKGEVDTEMTELEAVGTQVKSRAQRTSQKTSTKQATVHLDGSEDTDNQMQEEKINADKRLVGRTRLRRKVQVSMAIPESDHAEETYSDAIQMPRKHEARINKLGRTSGKGVAHLPPNNIPAEDSEQGADDKHEETCQIQQPQPHQEVAIWSKTKPTPAKQSDPEPSAFRYLEPPVDNPRRVGLASHPTGQLRTTQSGRSNAAKKPVTKKYVQNKSSKIAPRGKKCPAEDQLQDSPAKWTRSQTVNIPTKRLKKPNSRYATNFVRG
ncbi:uncharacterized protein F5891DRAFT_987929 [Suillus fuscotomentosus]|uniref:Uncharacterized protein n=1 Tax=Suillus fuscotomentosus TaxID=1912939 RepID=A0AAD4DPE1_9AGAM|nr:uncharacterized protein F5891DRAFT_987929 [Suillus fuscotomentosus]KAG1887970.1 hypothetical protein F5891DRAFT_987929 [Suillus fuscotomentosus]